MGLNLTGHGTRARLAGVEVELMKVLAWIVAGAITIGGGSAGATVGLSEAGVVEIPIEPFRHQSLREGPLDCDFGEQYDYSEKRCVDKPGPEDCDFDERFDYLEDRCVPGPLSCDFGEEYDYSEKRCVDKPGPEDCDFDERFDYLEDRCVAEEPGPLDCGFGERYDYLEGQCVPY